MSTYQTFLAKKQLIDVPTGIDIDRKSLNVMLKDFQTDTVKWSLNRGRAAEFADCGLGKTPMQLEFSAHVPGNVLILAPLAVSHQTVREGVKFGIPVSYCRNQDQVKPGITITNYEMLEHFDPTYFAGVVLDESSILKSYSGVFRNALIEKFARTPFRLACTATPAPNDYMELGNHSEFLGVMTREEMLSMFFVHDGGETQKWRLKGHAETEFWKWVCSWAVMIRKPSDLGYADGDFILPSLRMHEIIVEADHSRAKGSLFQMEAQTLQERQQARRNTTESRCRKAAEIASSSDEPWLIWCDRNDESEMLSKLISDTIEIRGSHTSDYKEKNMLGFSDGTVKRLVTKPSIAGYGMNWQHCCKVIFVGLSDSYEQFYQAIRRSWRFGQKNPVDCYVVTSSVEGAVVANIKRKEADAMRMASEMVKNMHVYNEANIKGSRRELTDYQPTTPMSVPLWLHEELKNVG